MTKHYKTLFPELNILTLGVIIALPMLVTLLFHFVIDPWVGPDGDDMLSRMFMLLSWSEALIPYFMFDGYSQNEQGGIAYLCSLPNGRKTVVSAFAGAVIYDLAAIAAAAAVSLYFPMLLGENAGIGIRNAVLMFACLSAIFGLFIMFCVLTRKLAVLIAVFFLLDLIFYCVYLLALGSEHMTVAVCIVSAVIYVVGVTFSVCSILKRMKGEDVK